MTVQRDPTLTPNIATLPDDEHTRTPPCRACALLKREPVPPLGLPLAAPATACVVCTNTMTPLAGHVFVCQKCSYMAFRLWPDAPASPAQLAVLRAIIADMGGSRARRLMLTRPPWRRPRPAAAAAPAAPPEAPTDVALALSTDPR